FCVLFGNMGSIFNNGRDKFSSLGINDQIKTLVNMVKVFKTGRADTCDLTGIGGAEKSGKTRLNSSLNKIKGVRSIRIIDQSSTGLYEKVSPNLLLL
ncbi:MAG: Cas9 endonuclease PAM-interacting domain-containing protein, partial [Oscillospiraceae bacterium]